jgi:hypothetical protein
MEAHAMPKPKRGPALFELLADAEAEAPETLKVPRWWGKGRAPDKETSSGEPSAARDDVSAAECRPVAQSVPFAELDGNRLRISFTSVTAAMALFGLMVGLLGAFELGRRSGEGHGFERGYESGRNSYAASAVGEIEAARGEPAATHVLGDLVDEPARSFTAAGSELAEDLRGAERPQWIRDHTYVVAQEFAADRVEEARRAQEFLRRRGVATELVRFPSGVLQLITTQGYDRQTPTQRRMADQLLSKVHAVGTEYYAAGGGYKLEGYFKTLKGDTW